MDAFRSIFQFRYIILQGIKETLLLSVIMMAGGIIVGSLAAIGLTAHRKSRAFSILKKIIRLYVEMFRGAPLLILLFFGYYGFSYLGFRSDPNVSCGIILILYAGAYICEIVRSGIEAIPKGQWEAAECLGLSGTDEMRFVIYPQALKVFRPSLIGFFIAAVKDTSIVSLVGCSDIFAQASVVVNRTGAAMAMYITIAIFFFIICYPMSAYVRRSEIVSRRKR